MSLSLSQYTRFLLVGAVVGLITVACRELIGRLLGVDNAARYSVSVVSAYALGIVLAYLLNRRHTFAQHEVAPSYGNFALFALIAVMGALCTWLLSLALRYGAHLNDRLGAYAAATAFALAALLSTLVTYPLNARFVFRRAR
jgi:putative flippase GtrA